MSEGARIMVSAVPMSRANEKAALSSQYVDVCRLGSSRTGSLLAEQWTAAAQHELQPCASYLRGQNRKQNERGVKLRVDNTGFVCHAGEDDSRTTARICCYGKID